MDSNNLFAGACTVYDIFNDTCHMADLKSNLAYGQSKIQHGIVNDMLLLNCILLSLPS